MSIDNLLMSTRLSVAFVVVLAALAAAVTAFWVWPSDHQPGPPNPEAAAAIGTVEPAQVPAPVSAPSPSRSQAPPATQRAIAPSLAEAVPVPFTKASRLAELRESFRALAAGDPKAALRAARRLTDDVERETALLALVTEWTHGELSPPRHRAWAVATYGLETGLGMELTRNPELAQLWTSEFTNSQARAVAPERLGPAMLAADPEGALAFAQQFNAEDRRKFFDAAFSDWARKDTEAALQWAEQLSDPGEREDAMKSIRSVAPVGIGVELGMQEGYPVINRMFPGTPAELSGQLRPGDRIVAVAQGNNVFVDTSGLPMQEVVQAIRGTPGTLLQLRVLPADAPPGANPRTVAVVRGQIKFKP